MEENFTLESISLSQLSWLASIANNLVNSMKSVIDGETGLNKNETPTFVMTSHICTVLVVLICGVLIRELSS